MSEIHVTELARRIKAFDPNIFIGASSFEERCFSVANEIRELELEETFICRNMDFDDNSIIKNSGLFQEKINSRNFQYIDLKADDPKFTFFQLNKSLTPIFQGNVKSIIFDITTFTHEILLIVFRILLIKKRPDDKIILCYNGAKTYSQRQKKTEEKWLTKGVKEIRSILGYPGFFDPSRSNHLIILFGFERERTLKLIEQFEYDLVSLAYATPEGSISPEHQLINENRHKEILSLNSNAQFFNISLKNPFVARTEILEFVQRYSNYNTVIAPMNNKLSTLGAGLAAIENPSIQLCYLQAQKYNTSGYSEAGDVFQIFEMYSP